MRPCRVLVESGRQSPDLVVSQIVEREEHAAAYVHAPRDASTMHEVFLVREAGLWKVRRFLGKRDDPEVMKAIVEARNAQGNPLSEEEAQWQRDPTGAAARQRTALLA